MSAGAFPVVEWREYRCGLHSGGVDRRLTVETDPILVFGKLLRALRERAGMSQKQLADTVHYSASFISAIENGTKPAKLDLVRRLDQALDAGGALVAVWPITTVGAYPSWFARIAELEAEAVKIHEWELRYIPGLLQTAEYTRELMRADRPRYDAGDDDESIEHDVVARIERQEILARENPPRAWFVIDESVLHRLIGGPGIMAKQLEHLEAMAEMTHIIVQILPFSVRSHSGGAGPLKILEFPDAPTVGYTEGRWSGRVVETSDEVGVAMSHFDLIRASALPPEESVKFIAEFRSRKYE
jgi:transcriptional regulator with XRE-family HTH domain